MISCRHRIYFVPFRSRWFTMILRNPSDDRSRSTSIAIILGWNAWTWSRRNRFVSSINWKCFSITTTEDRAIEEPFIGKRKSFSRIILDILTLKLCYSSNGGSFPLFPQFLSNLLEREGLTDTYVWLITITKLLNRNLYGVMNLCIRNNSNFWVLAEVEYQCPQ